jgi:ectoine hydroxylase-related dioxygenase (phytanoyl-CoA dioxygenase family)
MLENNITRLDEFCDDWERTGAVKVNGLLPLRQLNELRAAVDASYDLLRQHVRDNPATVNVHLADHFIRWDGLWMKELLVFLDNIAPEILHQFNNAIHIAEEQFHSLFSEDWQFNSSISWVRRHRSTALYLPWHIDADGASLLKTADYSINMWLPLDPVGDDAPSLEFIPGSNKTMRNLPILATTEAYRTPEWVNENFTNQPWTPHAVPGDAILFDHWTLHRTQRVSRENVLRTSCELRFIR